MAVTTAMLSSPSVPTAADMVSVMRAREEHMKECRTKAYAIRQWLLQRGSEWSQDLLTRRRSLQL